MPLWLLSLVEWAVGLFIKEKLESHDAQMQAMGRLQQGNADSSAALSAAKKVQAADAAAPKTESELDKKLEEGKA